MKLTAAKFQYFFIMVVGMFSFTVFYEQLKKEKRVYVEVDWLYRQNLQSHKALLHQTADVATKREVKRLENEIKDLNRVLERRQRLEIRIKSSFYMSKSSGDLALEKKYPEFPMTFTHRDVHMCGATTYKVLVLVFSENENQDLRHVIRKTWGALKIPETELRWRVIFIVGRPLDKAGNDKVFFDEVMRNDLLGVHAKNSKTMQALYGALYWAINGCSFEKLLVMRENMFLNVEALYKGIHRFQQKRHGELYINTLSSGNPGQVDDGKKTSLLKGLQTFNPNGAWMMSRKLATRLLPDIRMFMNSDFEGTSSIVDEMMTSKLGFKSQKSKQFFTDQKQCVFSPYILSVQNNSSCVRKIYRQIGI